MQRDQKLKVRCSISQYILCATHCVLCFRPHCGGEGFSYIPPEDTNIAGMVEYFSAGRAVYNCSCPAGITGDKCGTCDEIEGVPRYTNPDTQQCADCDCSNLSQSTICDTSNGQCTCSNPDSIDLKLAGRQCVCTLHPAYFGSTQ